MTYQSSLQIKEETPSPAGSYLSTSETSDNYYSENCTSTESWATGISQGQPLTALSPCKRIKLNSEDMPASKPETKHKLKNTVLRRRRARGDSEISENLFQNPKPSQLTPADIEKQNRRKQQNREAAKRCRAKKKETQDTTAQEIDKTLQQNKDLNGAILAYIQIINVLRKCLMEHLNCGDCKLSSTIQENHRHQADHNHLLSEEVTSVQLDDQSEIPRTEAATPIDCEDIEERGFNYQPPSNESYCCTPNSVFSNDMNEYSYAVSSAPECYPCSSLPSWDLQNIIPDIHKLCPGQSQPFESDHMIDALVSSFLRDPELEEQQVKPVVVTTDLFTTTRGSNSAICAAQTKPNGDEHNNNLSLSSVGKRNTASLEVFTEGDSELPHQILPFVQPNLVQPNYATFQPNRSLPGRTGTQEFSNNRSNFINRAVNQQIKAFPDLNNNGSRRSSANRSIHPTSGSTPALTSQPGSLPPQSGSLTPQSGSLPLQSGSLPPQPGDYSFLRCHILTCSHDEFRQ